MRNPGGQSLELFVPGIALRLILQGQENVFNRMFRMQYLEPCPKCDQKHSIINVKPLCKQGLHFVRKICRSSMICKWNIRICYYVDTAGNRLPDIFGSC